MTDSDLLPTAVSDPVPSPSGAGGRRAHRDQPAAGAKVLSTFENTTQAAIPWITQRAATLDGQTARRGARTFAAELRRGHRWMRFSRRIERQFQVDAAATDWTRLTRATLIGHIALWCSVLANRRILPGLFDRLMPWWVAASLLALLCVGGCMKLIRPEQRRSWQMDLAASLPPMLMVLGLVAGARDEGLPATVLSANVVLLTMWSCILARQRFWFAVLGAGFAVVAYVLGAGHAGPLQSLVVLGNTRLLVVATGFALVTNYALEHHERRAYLLRKVEAQQRQAVADAGERLRQLSLRDPLTGLFNRRQFDEELQQAWQQAAAAQLPLSLVMVDVTSSSVSTTATVTRSATSAFVRWHRCCSNWPTGMAARPRAWAARNSHCCCPAASSKKRRASAKPCAMKSPRCASRTVRRRSRNTSPSSSVRPPPSLRRRTSRPSWWRWPTARCTPPNRPAATACKPARSTCAWHRTLAPPCHSRHRWCRCRRSAPTHRRAVTRRWRCRPRRWPTGWNTGCAGFGSRKTWKRVTRMAAGCRCSTR
jgi:hypothetical protein